MEKKGPANDENMDMEMPVGMEMSQHPMPQEVAASRDMLQASHHYPADMIAEIQRVCLLISMQVLGARFHLIWDCVQQVFVQMLALENQPRAPIKWAAKAAYNEARRINKREDHFVGLVLDDDENPAGPGRHFINLSVPPAVLNLLEDEQKRESLMRMEAHVRNAIMSIADPDDQQLYHLRVEQHYSMEQVAVRMDISKAAANKRLYRLLIRLGNFLFGMVRNDEYLCNAFPHFMKDLKSFHELLLLFIRFMACRGMELLSR